LFDIEVKEEVPVTVSEKNLERRLKRRGPATWKMSLGAALIEDMRWIDDELIYVSLRMDSAGLENLDHLAVNATDGNILWRAKRPNEDDRYSILYASSASLLFSIADSKGKQQLLALNAQNGSKRWSFDLKAAKKSAPITPTIVVDAGVVIATDGRAGKATAIRIDTGEHLWQRQVAKRNRGFRPLLTNGQGLWDPNGPLTAISVIDEKSIWQSELHIDVSNGAPAQFSKAEMYVIDSNGDVMALDVNTGAIKWRHTLSTGLLVSNIYPYEDRIYLRCKSAKPDNDNSLHQLVALDRKIGTALWKHQTTSPSLSNLIHSGDAIYHATGSDVYKLNRLTGQQKFAVSVTNTGRNFPVRLRMLENHIAYIGELVIAGIERNTGQILFSHGMTPISTDTSLNTLDVSIPRLREQMGAASSSGGSFSGGEAARYQNMANNYHSQAQNYRSQAFMARSSGNSSASDSAQFRAMEAQSAGIRASNQARTMASIEMSMAVMNLAMHMSEMWRIAGIKATVDRQILFRNSILANYALAENISYVFRPHSRYRAADDNFAGIDIINLETGGSRFNYLSPSYQSYGLWNLVDFNRGMVIHHGVGLDSSDYHYSEPRKANMVAPKTRTVENFLIAVPIRLP
jgi:outer membrane protein assembly factor BamB